MGVIKDIAEFQPSKVALVWTAVGASALTVAAGFMLGLVVTAGSAQDMANKAASNAHAELAGSICAANFRISPTAQELHAEIAGLSMVRQRQLIQGQPWALYPGAESLSRDAASVCAREIAQMDPEELVTLAVDEPGGNATAEPL